MSFRPGPWDSEPNEQEFTTKAGLLACIHRHPSIGHLCGYVRLPAGHQHHGKSYDDAPGAVHGGLTYADNRLPWETTATDYWWLGFDAAHLGDQCPGEHMGSSGTYRDMAYMARECECLAAELEL